MMKLHLKVEKFIQKNCLLKPEQPVIIGLSGGSDSVALLHILLRLEYNCVVAHCNFKLRKEESERDESFVRNLVKDLSIKSHFISFETKNYAHKNGISIEMAARELRYEWFNKLIIEENAQAVAVGHHADDNIETLLLNLIRGTGIKGLCGIPSRNELVVRPLLCCTRQEIEVYLKKSVLKYVTDSTNYSNEYKRNKIRNIIIPLLEEINPSIRKTLQSEIEIFNQVQSVYEQTLANEIRQCTSTEGNSTIIDIDQLLNTVEPNSVLFEVLIKYEFSQDSIHRIFTQLVGEAGKRFYAPKYQLLIDRKKLIISPKKEIDINKHIISKSDTLVTTPLNIKISTLEMTTDFIISKSKNRVQFDAETLVFPLEVRRWQEGDFFYPFGMNNKKKISDFFIDIKLNRIEKENVWIITSNKKIVWVVGYRTDNRFRISNKTESIIELELNL